MKEDKELIKQLKPIVKLKSTLDIKSIKILRNELVSITERYKDQGSRVRKLIHRIYYSLIWRLNQSNNIIKSEVGIFNNK